MRYSTDKSSAFILVDLLSQHGITDVVVSPGSRNAPLIVALHEMTEIRKHIVVDERAAAFMALGIASTRQCSVALVCTSGTALLNYAPAVAEAFYKGTPLVVISADRPMQWIDQDDSQTIRQYEALQHFVKGSFDIPDFDTSDKEMLWYANRTINQALIMAVDAKPGPVHINMQFNAPLTHSVSSIPLRQRYVNHLSGSAALSKADLETLALRCANAKVVVCAGYMPPSDKLSKALAAFASFPNVYILAEKLANLHIKQVEGGIDRIIPFVKESEMEGLLPDIVITLGGALVSRKVKEWFRSMENVEHWSIDRSDMMADCFRHLSLKLKMDPTLLFKGLTHYMRKCRIQESDYQEKWRMIERDAEINHNNYFTEIADKGCSDLAAFNLVMRMLPSDYNLHLSNGTSVRYAELTASASQHAIYCNRGTSGIEGCTSTAVGSAMVYNGNTLLITGDMSFRHDLGGLALPYTPDRFKIIVMNNNGGDIFRFINSTSSLDMVEEYFSCGEIMSPPIKDLATTFGYAYMHAENLNRLHDVLNAFFAEKRRCILEIDTSAVNNAEILRGYFKH